MTTPADQKVTSNRGWGQLQHTLGRKMPQRLHATARNRYALLALTKKKGR